MITDLLRRAAAAEREDWGGNDNARTWPQASALHLALADWLDEERYRIEGEASRGGDQRPYEPAERVARIILDELDRP